jgi:hypothetical protein
MAGEEVALPPEKTSHSFNHSKSTLYLETTGQKVLDSNPGLDVKEQTEA